MDAVNSSNKLKRRFLIAGAYNTAFGYCAFVTIKVMLPDNAHYLVILFISFSISLLQAFLVQKYLVFQTKGNIFSEFFRFISVNISAFVLNSIILSALVGICLNVLVAQAFSTILTILLSYFGHRRFTFRS